MGTVIEFPFSRVRDGSYPLITLNNALATVFGVSAVWFTKRKAMFVVDRAGIAVLTFERFCADGMRLILRIWNNDRADYDRQFDCLMKVSTDGRTVDCVLDLLGNPLPFLERKRLHEILETAECALSANTVIRAAVRGMTQKPNA